MLYTLMTSIFTNSGWQHSYMVCRYMPTAKTTFRNMSSWNNLLPKYTSQDLADFISPQRKKNKKAISFTKKMANVDHTITD